ncbi:MAG: hypothetical protein KME30_06320 [Iphinoe sp. HA4291-MV1]|nr:hypothetical protein [Iphinoe sp. HA4291-MV1]
MPNPQNRGAVVRSFYNSDKSYKIFYLQRKVKYNGGVWSWEVPGSLVGAIAEQRWLTTPHVGEFTISVKAN